MARRRNGQCSLCGDWIPLGHKGRKCPPCKNPTVRAAKRQLRSVYRRDREEVEVERSSEAA